MWAVENVDIGKAMGTRRELGGCCGLSESTPATLFEKTMTELFLAKPGICLLSSSECRRRRGPGSDMREERRALDGHVCYGAGPTVVLMYAGKISYNSRVERRGTAIWTLATVKNHAV